MLARDFFEVNSSGGANKVTLKEGVSYYQLFGVEEYEKELIERAYRKLALQFHPDKNAGDLVATGKFQIISNAYEVLNNPELRADYDHRIGRSSTLSVQSGGGAWSAASVAPGVEVVGFSGGDEQCVDRFLRLLPENSYRPGKFRSARDAADWILEAPALYREAVEIDRGPSDEMCKKVFFDKIDEFCTNARRVEDNRTVQAKYRNAVVYFDPDAVGRTPALTEERKCVVM